MRLLDDYPTPLLLFAAAIYIPGTVVVLGTLFTPFALFALFAFPVVIGGVGTALALFQRGAEFMRWFFFGD